MRLFCVILFFLVFFLSHSCNKGLQNEEVKTANAAPQKAEKCDHQAAYEAWAAYQQSLEKERKIQMEHYHCDRTTLAENKDLWERSWKAEGETRKHHQELIAIIGGAEGTPLRCPDYQQYLPDSSHYYYTDEVYQPQKTSW